MHDVSCLCPCNLVNNTEIFRILQSTIIGFVQNVCFASVGLLEIFSLVFGCMEYHLYFVAFKVTIYFNLYNKGFYFLVFKVF